MLFLIGYFMIGLIYFVALVFFRLPNALHQELGIIKVIFDSMKIIILWIFYAMYLLFKEISE